VVGSISHSSDVAVAVLGPASYWECLGVDVELLFGTGADITEVVCTRSERERYAAFKYMVCILFSAKESIYKAINPLFGIACDFQEVEVYLKNSELFGARGSFEACVSTINQENDRPLSIVGRWIIYGDTVYTSAFRQRNRSSPSS
jgi:4'-phosphopantetheinyl transferase EntD